MTRRKHQKLWNIYRNLSQSQQSQWKRLKNIKNHNKKWMLNQIRSRHQKSFQKMKYNRKKNSKLVNHLQTYLYLNQKRRIKRWMTNWSRMILWKVKSKPSLPNKLRSPRILIENNIKKVRKLKNRQHKWRQRVKIRLLLRKISLLIIRKLKKQQPKLYPSLLVNLTKIAQLKLKPSPKSKIK